jgi:hypothetical protein
VILVVKCYKWWGHAQSGVGKMHECQRCCSHVQWEEYNKEIGQSVLRMPRMCIKARVLLVFADMYIADQLASTMHYILQASTHVKWNSTIQRIPFWGEKFTNVSKAYRKSVIVKTTETSPSTISLSEEIVALQTHFASIHVNSKCFLQVWHWFIAYVSH